MNYFDLTQRQKIRKFLLHLRCLCLVSLLCDHKIWGVAAMAVKEATVVVEAGVSGSAEALASELGYFLVATNFSCLFEILFGDQH